MSVLHTSPCVPDSWDGFGEHGVYISAWIHSHSRIWETLFSLTECLCQTGQTAWSLCTSWTVMLYWCKKKQHRLLRESSDGWTKRHHGGMLLFFKTYDTYKVMTYWSMVATASLPLPCSLTVMYPQRTSWFHITTSTL